MLLRDLFPNVNIRDIDNRIKNGTITAGEIIDLYKGKEWVIIHSYADHHGCEFLLTCYDIIPNTENKIKRMIVKRCSIDFDGCLVISVVNKMKLKDILSIIKLGRIRVYGRNNEWLYLGHPMPLYNNHEDKYTDILDLEVEYISADCMCEQAYIEIYVRNE